MNASTQIIQTHNRKLNHYHNYITNPLEVSEIELQCYKCTVNVINEHLKQPRQDNDYALLNDSKSGNFYDTTTHESNDRCCRHRVRAEHCGKRPAVRRGCDGRASRGRSSIRQRLPQLKLFLYNFSWSSSCLWRRRRLLCCPIHRRQRSIRKVRVQQRAFFRRNTPG